VLQRLLKPIVAAVWFFIVFIIFNLISAGMSLSQIAEYAEWSRSQFLYDGGLHANAYALFSAIVFALLLGYVGALQRRTERTIAIATMAAALLITLLTFSRSAMLAVLVVVLLQFRNASVAKRLLLAIVLLGAVAFLPSELFDRFRIVSAAADLDRFSSGRLEGIWQPLLSDVGEHLWFGQGHYSIYWTQSQQDEMIYPVTHAHNGLLDLLLDYGIVGTAVGVAFYTYVWRQFKRLSERDPSAEYRSIFRGAQLAMVVFIFASFNGRLTPEAIHFPLWIVIGLMFGRITALPYQPRNLRPQ
jgi:O-antigen ligase